MKKYTIFVLLLLINEHIFSANYDRTIISKLQELCPYTSFCEENATLHFPESDTERPCCEPCSCKPGCEKDYNCCFDRIDIGTTCIAPMIDKKATKMNYMMTHSCISNLNNYDSINKTMCVYNDSDYKSFAPVVSKKSGETFVNSECATCNQVKDIVPWILTINCLPGIDGPRNEIIRLLNGEHYETDRCFLHYVPPKHMNLELQECRNDVIRECNVTGQIMEWEPLWDYCPIVTAPYSMYGKMFANIFCYLCNVGYTYPLSSTCREEGYRIPDSNGFMALIENTDFKEEKSLPVKSSTTCGPTEKFVHSLKTECRKIECSLGKIRIGDVCIFYSKEWIGGDFVVVFKLTPLDKTKKMDISILSHLQSGFKNDKKATWLKRNTMKSWNVYAMYRPSADNKFIMYFVVQLIFPNASVNPAGLWTSLSKALKDIWTLETKLETIRLRVHFNRHEHYKKRNKNTLLSDGIHIKQEYGHVNLCNEYEDNDEKYLLAVFPTDDEYFISNREFLNELFLCDLIELRPEEFLWIGHWAISLTTTNETLHEAEYRSFQINHPLVCLNRLHENKGVSSINHFQISVFIVVLWVEFKNTI